MGKLNNPLKNKLKTDSTVDSTADSVVDSTADSVVDSTADSTADFAGDLAEVNTATITTDSAAGSFGDVTLVDAVEILPEQEVKTEQEIKTKKVKKAKKDSSDTKDDMKNATKKSTKKKSKASASDNIWLESNAREEKKKQKSAKKEKLREIHFNELVNEDFAKNKHRAQAKDERISALGISALELAAKSIIQADSGQSAQSIDCTQSVIANLIGNIINSAAEENRKNNEKALIKRKEKRLLKQERLANISHCAKADVEMGEVYPIDVPVSIQEHLLYRQIMEHGLNVAGYARMLFLGLEPLHGLSGTWLQRLLLAAQYHDVGVINSAKAHHKHSYVRINSDMEILIPDEDRVMVALLARYHRKTLPSQKHPEFTSLSLLEQEELCKVAAILRIADALDYGHEGVIKKIDVSIGESTVTLICHSPKSIVQEVLRTLKKSDLFVRTFNKEIVCKQA